jgi:SAM-dependent methyltransferase
MDAVAPITGPSTDLLIRFLRAYWLRPENALWMTLRSRALSRVPLAGPCMDVSCGDGVFTFLHCGGVFDPDFDVFTAVGDVTQAAERHADMFDHVQGGYQPTIISPPQQRIDQGTDNKPSMIAKAKQLSLYSSLVEHDNNEPLPFSDQSFQTVYCNAAYWVSQVDPFLSELCRITKRQGCVVLQVKLSSLRDYTLAAHRSALGDRLLDILDRGRTDCWPTLADRATWESRFARAGFIIKEAHPFVTKTHAHIWDIGLRPIAPLLVKMTSALTRDSRSSIKSEWVDLFRDILEPLCKEDFDLFDSAAEPAEIQYVLTPAK